MTTKASEFMDAPKVFIFKHGEEGMSVAENCRKAGISHAVYLKWSAGR